MPTGLFDELIAADEAKDSQESGKTGLFDELIDRDEGTTRTGKYYKPEERKGITYLGRYFPSDYEHEKKGEEINPLFEPGVFGGIRQEGFQQAQATQPNIYEAFKAVSESPFNTSPAQEVEIGRADLAQQRQFSRELAPPSMAPAEMAKPQVIRQLQAEKAAERGDTLIDLETKPIFGMAKPEDFEAAGYGRNTAEWMSGAQNVAAGIANGLTSPENIAMMGAGLGKGAAAGAARAAANAYAAQIAVSAPVHAKEAYDAYKAGDMVLFKQKLLQATTDTLFTFAAIQSKSPKEAAHEKQIKETYAALKKDVGKVEVLPPEQTGLARQPASERGPVIDIETIVNPEKPLEPSSVKMIEDGIGKAISENKSAGEAPGLIAGTALEKWADDVMSSEFRGRLSINPIDLLAKEIPALAIKGASVIERGIRDYPAWSAEMSKLYGDEFKSILRKVYMQSLQVKGTTPNAILTSPETSVQPLREQPGESAGQVPQTQGRQEVVSRSEPALQPREGTQAQVPLTEILNKPVQEIAATYESIPPDQIASFGVENFNRALGAKAKTPEDIAALKAMAESHSARINQLKKEGNFPEAMRLSGFQPMEAYRFATEAQPASRGIAASARDRLASDVPHGTEAGFVRLPEQFKQAVEAFNVNDPAAPQVVIDKTSIVPRLQPWGADKKISSTSAGVGRIPGVGRLFDPRTGAFSEVDQAIIANAKERSVGESVAALWGQTHKAADPFPTTDGQITMAGGARGHMADVIEAEMRNPGSQPLTPAQRAWVEEVWHKLKVVWVPDSIRVVF